MNLTTTQRLQRTVAAVCPIVGLSVPTAGVSATVVIQFAAAATAAQKTAAQNAVNAFDWSNAADATWQAQQEKNAATAAIDKGQLQGGAATERQIRALALLVLDEINLIRANFTPAMTPRTSAQLIAAYKAKIAATAE